ncbi:hypothetical protein D3C78_1623510 [compost metagenome]
MRLLNGSGVFEEALVVSESGLLELLCVYCYHPENRLLRRWLSQEVLARLRRGEALAG